MALCHLHYSFPFLQSCELTVIICDHLSWTTYLMPRQGDEIPQIVASPAHVMRHPVCLCVMAVNVRKSVCVAT